MSRRSAIAMLAGLLILPTIAHAQRGMGRFRNSPAMSADGPVFNPTMTPEWQQAGGNMEVWQQIMAQKMAAREQAAFQKQLAEYQKLLKAQAGQAKSAPTGGQGFGQATLAPLPRRKKKRPTLQPSAAATAKANPKDAKTGELKGEIDEDDARPPATDVTVAATQAAVTAGLPAPSAPEIKAAGSSPVRVVAPK